MDLEEFEKLCRINAGKFYRIKSSGEIVHFDNLLVPGKKPGTKELTEYEEVVKFGNTWITKI